MVPLLFLPYLFQSVLTVTSQILIQTNQTSLQDTISRATGPMLNDNQYIFIPEGTSVENNVEISHRSLELSGEWSFLQNGPGTRISSSYSTQKITTHNTGNLQTPDLCIFSLTNSTLTLQSIHFSLIANSQKLGQQMNQTGAPRLAIVSNSMLTISESRIELSPWTSAILISPSTLEESCMDSSVIVIKCSFSSESDELAGIVETSAFPDDSGAVSVSTIGCSFNSQKILGKDGIGLSLTQTARKSEEDIGTISSSLIGCSFVNMSSIGSSRQPHLPHLSQKMLGCVVSRTSSHLSGSTIRDMKNGGSLLCTNSSFSFLLPSPNTDSEEEPTITLPDGTNPEFEDGTEYSFTSKNGTDATFVSFSHCHFTGANYALNVRPVTFFNYSGTISILSCSFTNIASTANAGGAISIQSSSTPVTNTARVELCNFTDCSAKELGAGLYLTTSAVVTMTGCRCEGCSLTGSSGNQYGAGAYVSLQNPPGSTLSDLYFEQCTALTGAGGLHLNGALNTHQITSLSFKECLATSPSGAGSGGAMVLSSQYSINDPVSLSHLKFEDCSTDQQGGGLMVMSNSCPILLTDSEFIRCTLSDSAQTSGAGGGLLISMNVNKATVKGCQFVDCSSTTLGGALFGMAGEFEMSDYLVKNCSSNASGNVCIVPLASSPITLNNILFVENTVSDTPTYFDQHESMKGSVQFADFLIEDMMNKNPTDVTITDCWTTTTPNSVGMYASEYDPDPYFLTYTRLFRDAFNDMKLPCLSQKVETSLDIESWNIKLIIKGMVPLDSQDYEITVKETEGGTELTGTLKFVGGVGSLVSSSKMDLKFSTTYTITKIVGVVPASSSESNASSITAQPWVFNLAKTPSFLSFTTPTDPSTVLVTRGGSDSIDECGGETLPCRTVWTGQMAGKGKGGEWMWILVRTEAEMGESFWMRGDEKMTLTSESSTQRSRVVIGNSSCGSSDGIVLISEATVQVKNLNMILPSSEECLSSGWVFVVESEGTLEVSSIGLSGDGQIGVGLAKVKSGTCSFNSILISSCSFGEGVGLIAGEGKWNQISIFISDLVVRDVTTTNTPLITFSSLSPLSTFEMEGSRFQRTRRMIPSSTSEGDGLIEVSTAQSKTQISDCVFQSCGVTIGTGTISRSALHITLNSSSASSRSLVISSCLFLDSHPSSSSSASLHIRALTRHTSIVFQDSWFEETTPTRLWKTFESGIACLDWTRRTIESSLHIHHNSQNESNRRQTYQVG